MKGLIPVWYMLPLVRMAMLRQFANIKPLTPAVFIPKKHADQYTTLLMTIMLLILVISELRAQAYASVIPFILRKIVRIIPVCKI